MRKRTPRRACIIVELRQPVCSGRACIQIKSPSPFAFLHLCI